MDSRFREHMHGFADMQAASQKSPVMSEQKFDAIIRHLQQPGEKVDPHFKHWVKTRSFQLMDIPAFGLNQVLVIINITDKGDGTCRFLQVVHAGQIFDIVNSVHSEKLNHSGYKKVLDYIQQHYFGVTRGFVQEFCRQCPMCQHSHPQTASARPPLCPVLDDDLLDRMQVDPVGSADIHPCDNVSCRSRLATLNERLTSLERRVEYIEARVTKGETLS